MAGIGFTSIKWNNIYAFRIIFRANNNKNVLNGPVIVNHSFSADENILRIFSIVYSQHSVPAGSGPEGRKRMQKLRTHHCNHFLGIPGLDCQKGKSHFLGSLEDLYVLSQVTEKPTPLSCLLEMLINWFCSALQGFTQNYVLHIFNANNFAF